MPSAAECKSHTKPGQPPGWQVNQFLERLRASRGRLLQSATVIRCLGSPPVFFPERPGSASQSKRSTCRVQVTNAHHGVEAVGKGLLHDMTRCAWSGVAVVFEPLLHGFAQFGGVPMSAILQARFALDPYFLQEAIGCRPTDRNSCHPRGFLPRMTGLHERDQLLFGCAVVLLFHGPVSFHGFPTNVRSSEQGCLARAIELGCEAPCRQTTASFAIPPNVMLAQARAGAQRSDG